MTVDAVIPALDEERSLGAVLESIDGARVRRVIVADNGSSDGTARVARERHAVVVFEPERGYGAACLRALTALESDPPDVVLFLDADGSDDPSQIPDLLRPLEEGRADLVVGSRVLGEREPGALTPHARFGNWLATRLVHVLYGARYTDLGPFRAIRYDALRTLGMKDRDFGWTVEMQVKAARRGLRHVEVPVRYRRRVGRSKISGTVVGSARAGAKILATVFGQLLDPPSPTGVG